MKAAIVVTLGTAGGRAWTVRHVYEVLALSDLLVTVRTPGGEYLVLPRDLLEVTP